MTMQRIVKVLGAAGHSQEPMTLPQMLEQYPPRYYFYAVDDGGQPLTGGEAEIRQAWESPLD